MGGKGGIRFEKEPALAFTQRDPAHVVGGQVWDLKGSGLGELFRKRRG